MTFILDARIDLTPDERQLFDRYALHDTVVYDSDARSQHQYSAADNYLSAAEHAETVPLLPELHQIPMVLGNAFASIWYLSMGGVHDVLTQMSLRITLASLLEGQHLESGSLEEMLAVSDNIRASVEYLANYLQVALTFDGREELDEY